MAQVRTLNLARELHLSRQHSSGSVSPTSQGSRPGTPLSRLMMGSPKPIVKNLFGGDHAAVQAAKDPLLSKPSAIQLANYYIGTGLAKVLEVVVFRKAARRRAGTAVDLDDEKLVEHLGNGEKSTAEGLWWQRAVSCARTWTTCTRSCGTGAQRLEKGGENTAEGLWQLVGLGFPLPVSHAKLLLDTVGIPTVPSAGLATAEPWSRAWWALGADAAAGAADLSAALRPRRPRRRLMGRRARRAAGRLP